MRTWPDQWTEDWLAEPEDYNDEGPDPETPEGRAFIEKWERRYDIHNARHGRYPPDTTCCLIPAISTPTTGVPCPPS